MRRPPPYWPPCMTPPRSNATAAAFRRNDCGPRFVRCVASKSFRAPLARESLFSAWPEKSNPKRGHPAWRFPPIHGRKVRAAWPVFSTAPPCAGEKESASCRFPCGPVGHTAPPHRGPAKSSALLRALLEKKPHQKHAVVFRFALAAARRLRIECEPGRLAALPGPCAAVSWGRQAAKRASAGSRCLFAGTWMYRRKARHRLTHFPGKDARKAPSGVAFLLGYFLFGHAKRK